MAFPYPYPGPIALYNNLPINANFYEPGQFVISDIDLGTTTTIETSEDHNFVVGQECRLLIPQATSLVTYADDSQKTVRLAINQLNGRRGVVLSIPSSNSVVLNIDSVGYNNFESATYTTQPQIVAVGDVNSGLTNSLLSTNTETDIPGSFINISPQ